MKVQENQLLLSSLFKTQQKDSAPLHRINPGQKGSGRIQDRVELTGSQKIEELVEQVKLAPEIRAEKVQQVSRQVRTGSYGIKAEEIAESIITGSILDELA